MRENFRICVRCFRMADLLVAAIVGKVVDVDSTDNGSDASLERETLLVSGCKWDDTIELSG